ncbi:hypothetical protein ColLi_12379 [Colletotrichum liriopes]|uniref:DUF6606 domain-containing protein n=1 Tax=Colletotrichum liriopes TaxID=708192 RepID=A0AA37H059_9PEZI|nr:hypothetical protein ColLi_12379 [Colletotrichum liriopes]
MATAMMRAMLRVHKPLDKTTSLDEGELLKMLQQLQNAEGAIALHVREQNAGVLITKSDDALHVEAFELSPTNEAITQELPRKGRLH